MPENKNNYLEKFRLLTDTRVLSLLAFGVIALLVTWSGIEAVQTNYELEKKIAVAKQENAIAELENANMKLKNQYYESSQYLELTTRRQFGKAAPGERLYTVPESVALAKTVEPVASGAPTATEESSKLGLQRNFDAWMKFLFN